MYRLFIGVLAVSVVTVTAVPAQGIAQNAIGNRANGFSYQPNPAEVDPLEQAAGVRPSVAQQKAEDRELDEIYRQLTRGANLGSMSVPRSEPRQ